MYTNIPTEDVQKYLLATRNFGKGMQDDINLYLTHGRLNNASFWQKLDPVERNIFLQAKSFRARIARIGLLFKKLDLGKKDVASTLIKKTPSTVDIEIQSGLDTLKNNPTFFNSNNNKNNNLLPSSPTSSFQLPQPPTFRASPSTFRHFQSTKVL